MRVLISGASIAGPVLAYWLTRFGHEVTVVERAPQPRKTGGHSVDLWRPALDIVERMGLLSAVRQRSITTERTLAYRPGVRRPASIDNTKIFTAVSDRHLEIMRDDLSEIFYDATRDTTEYVFADSLASISESGDVTFEHGRPRRFDLVIGADGLHSTVRRLAFGPESRFTDWVGAYLAVASVPRDMARDGVIIAHFDVGRTAMMYTAPHLQDARVLFLFRTERPLDYHHRDADRQKTLLREHFAGHVPRWLAELDQTPSFYFDSITQVRLDTWSRGRVALVGDAGLSPGPAIGASTSLAVLSAYVLAGQLAEAAGDHVRAYAAYQSELEEFVQRSRAFARGMAKTLLPSNRLGLSLLVNGTELATRLPSGMTRWLATLNSGGVRLFDTFPVRDYQPPTP
ncbi:FAD-dependent monooxygenase [Nonomuraea endophytica]|uniref:2-polyprenyl-6-methoxyphenol hydroxylase-like FAD-dependent oxidoreductase n=1 Tax=Nonomuraea endophytica TaxID=714136 RepID=A0A7W8EDQ0_9ACTN|nr:FAD-dependent monooxygenase [Nonomuraea endophytica]MBB5075789.1 2-polyprenyl-6-methoxyphenol hydroxylase-like FAD-dependent oxidoreductase [Nonomuraea endophytica]